MLPEIAYCLTESVNPYANLALESYLLATVPEDKVILYLWQNRRTVVIGRNQNPWRECRISQLEADGGHLVRRLSGGGAVFHDLGNLNFTFIAHRKHYDVDKQLRVILQALSALGLHGQKNGRNDLTIDGRKFSGNAFYQQNTNHYHHGTLLVHTDSQALARYLTVDAQKLQSKGVASVQSRIVNLKTLLPTLTIAQLQEALLAAFAEVYGQNAASLDSDQFDLNRLTHLQNKFADPHWNLGAKIPFTYQTRQRFPWGDLEIQLAVNRGQITQAALYSDSLETALFGEIATAWRGQPMGAAALQAALEPLSTPENREILGDIGAYLAQLF